jgi:glycosyltransferase involved in cell wall biosynthesis
MSSPLPVISVVMSIRDSAATVEAAVRSIVAQSFADWELIVIDDGSTDDGAERVAAVEDPRIRIFRRTESLGLPRRLNEAVTLSRGEFIARMDADDVSYPVRLATQLALLRREPALDLVASKALVFRGAGEPIGVFPVATAHEKIVARRVAGFYFPHPTWCGRAVWFRAHPYDERMMKAQDQELLLRTAATSRFGAVDAILLGYRHERLDVAKSLKGRALFARALWRDGRRSGRRAAALRGMTAQLAKSAADVAAIRLGMQSLLLRWRYAPAAPDDMAQWSAIWASVSGHGVGVDCGQRDFDSCAV